MEVTRFKSKFKAFYIIIDEGFQYFKVNLDDREYVMVFFSDIFQSFIHYPSQDKFFILNHLISEKASLRLSSICLSEDNKEEDTFDHLVPGMDIKRYFYFLSLAYYSMVII